MKKILLALVFFGTATLGLSNVNAELTNINDIDTNTYIIGDRVYELNKYYLSVYDVVVATNEYTNNHNGAIAPIYYLGENGESKFLLEITGVADANGIIPTKTISDITTVYPDNKIDATAINNSLLEDYAKLEMEPKIIAAVDTLNKTAKDYGFSKITYDNKTVTFEINDLARELKDYKNSGILSLAMDALTSATKVNYNLGTDKEVDLTVLSDEKIIGLAKEVLAYLAEGDELTYEAVANKSISATITYENEGKEYVETYTLEFVYDEEKVKEEIKTNFENAVATLDETATDYGFGSITSNGNKVTFEIADLTRELKDYQASGIVSLALNALESATKVNYNLGTDKEVDLTVLNDEKIIALAKEVLAYLAEGEDLTYEAVANKSISATVTYEKAGITVTETYTLEFIYSEENVKEEITNTVVNAVSTINGNATNYGFSNITLKDNVLTFNISDGTKELKDYANSGVLTVLTNMLEYATKANYNLGTEKEVDLTVLSDEKIINLAKEVLAYLAEGKDLVYSSVYGKDIDVTVTYEKAGVTFTETYTVKFVEDVIAAKDTVLSQVALDLSTTASNFGFEEVKYDAVGKKATFVIANPGAPLSAYQDSGIINLFMANIDGAEKISYEVNGEPRTVYTEDLISDTAIIQLASELLLSKLEEGEDLTLGAVAGEEIVADLTYMIDGLETVQTYRIEFTMGN